MNKDVLILTISEHKPEVETAKDIIDFIIRHKEIEDLDKRLAAIEQRLMEQNRR